MTILRPGLVIALGFGCVAWGEDTQCRDGNVTCKMIQEEDSSMVQVRRSAGQKANPHDRKSYQAFALASRPFLGGEGGEVMGSEQGKLIIDEDGVKNTYYLPGATTLDAGKTVKYTPPYRFYLMKEPTTDYSDASKFYKPAFVGKTFSVDINFGSDGPSCGCNLNFYLVDMPVPQAGKDKDHYCDAQCFPGLGCCSEFDMNEGNMVVQQITNHACTGDYNGHPDWACNKWGDPELKTQPSDFNKGQATIDSTKPFTYSQRFDAAGDDFTFTTTISQNGREVVLRMGPGSSQLNAMLKVIQKGMAFVTGYWFAQDMNWMDGDVCGSGPEHCSMNPAFISNWRLTTNTGPAPGPAPAPAPSPSGGGKCCWGGQCQGCNDDPNNWCNKNAAQCGQCSGQWCASR